MATLTVKLVSGEGFSLGLDGLLTELRRRQWTLIRWGPQDAPALLAAMFKWETCADVLILRNENHATAYRVPITGDSGVFNPQAVSYQYHHSPLWTLRAILALPAPGNPGAPGMSERPKYPECAIPNDLPRPVMIRPLSPYACGGL
ncbi:hypothetical protein [Saccharopolyspora phatthalungensis]|uniref:Uncharacterized protein n=1 Tax=Saccharopolyspora phatthalungensis TaxID=664693 RepID=A0A840QE04_9PSEU|nr:hypothetical protein [Saccharopolyspora phatthalungensis]MBB5158060.1 hypothetical protein [Saccharopolyspora phatthalungensis]